MAKTKLEELHQSLARKINRAKKQMFKRNREGADPETSYGDFLGDIGVYIHNEIWPPHRATDESETPATETTDLDDDDRYEQSRLLWDDVERLAAKAVQGLCDCEDNERALVALLDHIANAPDHEAVNLAGHACRTVFKNSTSLLDPAIDLLLGKGKN